MRLKRARRSSGSLTAFFGGGLVGAVVPPSSRVHQSIGACGAWWMRMRLEAESSSAIRLVNAWNAKPVILLRYHSVGAGTLTPPRLRCFGTANLDFSLVSLAQQLILLL